MDDFDLKNKDMISKMAQDRELADLSRQWITQSAKYEYSYHFSWMGRPIIQYPQDMVAAQEIIWNSKPDLIVETGIARGGSIIFYASLLELLGQPGKVVGIDVDIRPNNKIEIQNHPMFRRIQMIEGSSTDDWVVAEVRELARQANNPLVVLDSNHTHEHVMSELELYSPLVKKGGYCIVLDTIVEDLPTGSFPNRPWDKSCNPKTAVWEFMKKCDRFVIDREIENKLLLTAAPSGYLKCVKD